MELLAPAGDFSKLQTAFQYGADAVYLGGTSFSMRSASDNFNDEQLARAVEYSHERGKKVYVAVNIMPRNHDLPELRSHVEKIVQYRADAIIVADPGAFQIVREVSTDIPIHISTQANVLNYRTALVWHALGAKRIILARELSCEEITEIRVNVPTDLELEVFVHGAMCVSYSGRCLLSSYMASRDPNRGDCAQPCRWNYSLMEEKRPGEYMPVFEDDHGTFIMNSRDLCLIRHIPDLARAGVASLKIEGRVKGEYYLATVVKAYREELDRYLSKPEKYEFDERNFEEVTKVSHRAYSTGFFAGDKGEQIFESSSYIRNYEVVAVILDYNPKTGEALCEQRNKFAKGDGIEVMRPQEPYFVQTADDLRDENGREIENTPHAKMRFFLKLAQSAPPGSFIRKAQK